jgi:hypothetical protein
MRSGGRLARRAMPAAGGSGGRGKCLRGLLEREGILSKPGSTREAGFSPRQQNRKTTKHELSPSPKTRAVTLPPIPRFSRPIPHPTPGRSTRRAVAAEYVVAAALTDAQGSAPSGSWDRAEADVEAEPRGDGNGPGGGQRHVRRRIRQAHQRGHAAAGLDGRAAQGRHRQAARRAQGGAEADVQGDAQERRGLAREGALPCGPSWPRPAPPPAAARRHALPSGSTASGTSGTRPLPPLLPGPSPPARSARARARPQPHPARHAQVGIKPGVKVMLIGSRWVKGRRRRGAGGAGLRRAAQPRPASHAAPATTTTAPAAARPATTRRRTPSPRRRAPRARLSRASGL